MTPNIQFQPDKIFIRNDLFERIIKSCKATNIEFLILKEKLGLCPYEVICDEQEFILPEIKDDIKELKKENKKSIKIKSSEEPKKIKISKESIKIKSPEEPKEIKISEELTEESIEIKSPEENENTTDWFDENEFKKY